MANNRELSQFANSVGYNDGDIGIGTDNPGAKLEVRDSSSQGIIIRSDSTQSTDTNKALRVRNNSDTNTFHVSHKGQGYFAGDVGINKTPSTYQFEVSGGSANTVASFESSDAISRILFKDNSGEAMVGAVGDALTFYTSTNATERLRIDSSGNLNLVSSSSSLTDLNFTASDLSVYARVEGGKSGSGVGDLRFHTYSGGLSEAARITSAGRVGINSTSPATALDIQSTKNTDGLTVTKAGTRSVFLGHNGSGNEGILVLKENGTTKIQLYAETGQNSYINSGNLGINRTNPDQRLNVSGNIEVNAYDNTGGGGGYNTSSGLIIGNLYDAGKSYSGSDDRTACVWQERGLDLDIATNDTLRMKITYDGNVGINTTSNNDGAHFQHYQSEVRHQSFQSTNGDLAIVTDNNSNPAAYIKGTGTADLLKVVDNSTTVFLVEDGGHVTKPNTPAFSVRRNSAQDIAHNTNTKVQWNTEIFDVGGNFDSSTNYRFTAPVAGKYLFLGHLYIYSTYQVEAKIYKNGSIYKRFSGPLGTGGNDNPNGMDFMDIIDLSENDYIEIFGYQYHTSSSTVTIYGGNEKETSFVGYLLG